MKTVLAATVVVVFGVASPAGAADSSGTLGKIKATGQISLGYREAAVPFS